MKPGASGTYEVSEGYPYTVPIPTSKIKEFSTGTISVPQGTNYNKTVSNGLTISVDRSTVRTTDVSTGQDITLSENAITAVFSQHINQSITDTTNVTLNKTEEYSDTINIGPFDEDMVYDVLWNKMIYSFDILMGEVHFRFDLPYQESFAGLREVKSGKRTDACYIRVPNYPNPIFSSIGIALTRKCNASCRMCCFECSPAQSETLSERDVHSVIDQAKEIEGLSRIGFSGGEATLYPELLLSSLAYAREAGMTTSLTSNGRWGEEESQCKRMLNAFRSVGLNTLTISVDQYHLEYVPLRAIVNIIRCGREIGVPLALAVGDSREGMRAIDILRELGPDAYTTNIVLYPFMPVGRGDSLADSSVYLLPYDPAWKCHNSDHLAILYDGSVYPCCSQAVYGSLLSIGNIRTRSLADIIDGYAGKCIFSTLRRRGLDWFVKLAREKFGIELPARYNSPCHLCNRLFTDKAFVDRLAEAVDQEYLQTIREFLET